MIKKIKERPYIVWGFTAVVVIPFVKVLSYYINILNLKEEIISWFQAFSFYPGFVLLGVGGWEIQTWSGKSSREIWDKRIFKFFSILAIILPMLAFSLKTNGDITPDPEVIELFLEGQTKLTLF